MDQAYRRFLRSSDLSTWAECLTSLERCVEREPHDLQELTDGAIVATFVSWLIGLQERRTAAIERRPRCGGSRRPSVAVATEHAEGPISTRATANRARVIRLLAQRRQTALVARRYSAATLALMIVPSDDARTIAQLREIALDAGPDAFPPAFYFIVARSFASEDHGSRALREYGRIRPTMVADLLGNLYERGGQWVDAHDVYKRSSWRVHGVRGALCAIVSSTSPGDLADAFTRLEAAPSAGRLRSGTRKSINSSWPEAARSLAHANGMPSRAG
jgi:hypothetical protein